ncbi:MAG: cob(I)yrinic acid a,c-diamide adenosyltransferase [Desulfobacteraceae bacterium]|nr:cob(I)yrinic acid a,c-diamide adenosyltransferase [Desulfobacteraceae bacterium]
METGYVHLYTGDGKGKTTAALGLSLRAAGHGLTTFIGQFMKGQYYGELTALKALPQVTVEQFGDEGCIQRHEVTDRHRAHAREGLARISQVMAEGCYSVIVMDEICVAIWFGLVSVAEVLAVVRSRPAGVELILTGRRAPEELVDAADLVTEMREVKHYYSKGVLARDGIER